MTAIISTRIKEFLEQNTHTWLVTGAAGFIGSHLVEFLLKLNQQVVGLDNFSTGYRSNLEEVSKQVPAEYAHNFHLIEGDIRSVECCKHAMLDIDYVLHHAALGSVPLSLQEPARTHAVNIDGFFNILQAAQNRKVKAFVYASSSSVYGDCNSPIKSESDQGQLLSPYAASKMINETYSKTFYHCYNLPAIGLRYFNIFGPRQSLSGPYSAVIPSWIGQLLNQQSAVIYGDGQTTRDFCYVDNVVQANLLAALTTNPECFGKVYNIAAGKKITLRELFDKISFVINSSSQPIYQPSRAGDIKHSLADISLAQQYLGYQPICNFDEGLNKAINWYTKKFQIDKSNLIPA